MPGIHSPITKPLILLDGLVKTTGGANKLAKGQFAIVNNEAVEGGAKIIYDFAGLPNTTPLKLRVGRFDNSRLRSNTAPYYETSYFTVKDLVSLKANFPKFTKQTFDDLVIGYDGINDSTAIELAEGQTTVFDIIISGQPVEVMTGNCEYVVKLHFGREVGESNYDAIKRLVERVQEFKLPFGNDLTELIDVKLVNSENLALTGVPHTFSSINVTDDGTSNALALVQAQYPYNVVLTNRDGLVSTYTILHPTSVTLSDFESIVHNVYAKDCADCLAGYTEYASGVVYHVTIEDDGADLSTTVDDLPGFVSGSIVKLGQKGGVGTYSLVTDNAVTDAEKTAFLTASAVKGTATIKEIGNVVDICSSSTNTTYTWVAGQTCYASTEAYSIQLKDNSCGETRLAELQEAFPNLTIVEGKATGKATRTVTISGSSGDASVVIAGTTYTTAYNTSPTQTATDFVADHAADILTATGAVVTSSGAVITIKDDLVSFPSVTAVSGGLTETIGALTLEVTATEGGCQRVYSTTVSTNLVCDECDPIFLQNFSSELPQGFDFSEWKLSVEPTVSEDAKLGIRLTGKSFVLKPTDITRDSIPFYETSTRIQAFGGYIEEENENFQPIYKDIFEVTRLDRAQDRDNLGYNFLPWEDVSRSHYLGESRHKDNLFARGMLGEESLLKFDKQYVTYELTWDDTKNSQSIGGRSGISHTEMIIVELGYQDAVELWLNKLAGKAGLETVNPVQTS